MIIKVRDLSKVYNSTKVLSIEELDLQKGESFGLVGNNGAGKTTFFRLLLDLIKPTSGSVEIKGVNVANTENWKSYIGSYLDEGYLIGHLTPEEYFNFIAITHDLSQEELQERLAPFMEIFNGEILKSGKYIRDLSRGNQKKVGISAALIGNPEILILDEPFSNLDPSTQFELRSYLTKLDQETETTILVSSHDLGHIAQFCSRIVILDEGRIARDIYANENTLSELEEFFLKKIKGV